MNPLVFVLVLAVFVSGCVSTSGVGDALQRGDAGPVRWEIVDVGQMESRDRLRLRWSYVILLKETAGSRVQFERVEVGAIARDIAMGGGVSSVPFTRVLEAKGQLRQEGSYTWGYTRDGRAPFGGTASLSTVVREYRFVGNDEGGRRVVVPVRVALDRSAGRRSRQPSHAEAVLPPRTTINSAALGSLAGRWEGYSRVGEFDIPVEAEVRSDGSVEIAENDPITNRWRASLSIRDNRVWYSGRETGTFTLYEDGSRRVLDGSITMTPSGAPSWEMPVRLLAVAPRATTPAGPVTTSPSPSAAPSPPPTPSVARAAPTDSAAPDLTGTYKGTVSGDNRRGRYSLDFILTVVQKGTQLSGTWATPGGGSGIVSGSVVGSVRIDLRLNELPPCAGEFTGSATIGTGGTTIGGSYAGQGCSGPVKATFSVTRQ